MKIYVVLFIFNLINCFLSLFIDTLQASEIMTLNESIIKVPKINVSPFLDGASLDVCWQQLKTYSIESSYDSKKRNIQLQVCRSKDKIFLKFTFKAAEKRDIYQCWHWDPVIQTYVLGNEKEEVLCIVISSQNDSFSDIWVWRSARTNSADTLDDMFMNQENKLSFDSGHQCWYGRFFGIYAGAVLPRFYNTVPSGSVADVDAVGVWHEGKYTIEMARKLNTGHKDDIIFKPGEYAIQLFLYIPNKKQLKLIKPKLKFQID